MAFPFFALSKNAWMKPLTYDHATVSIEVRPSANGAATIYDKEIVLYIASLMAASIEAGEDVGQDFILTAHDLFSVTGSNYSARSYNAAVRGAGTAAGHADQDQYRGSRRRARTASSRGCRRRGCTTPRRAPGSAG